ncbi:hypothetical protein J3459_017629 [Metarhizium acridum]|nr:hypothetical protein J3459_017629 [Metarhizium acridum]
MPPHDPGGDTPEHFPREIHPPESPSDVSQALNRATQLKTTVGVRSSGHIMNFPGAIHDGILIDTLDFNRRTKIPESRDLLRPVMPCRRARGQAQGSQSLLPPWKLPNGWLGLIPTRWWARLGRN